MSRFGQVTRLFGECGSTNDEAAAWARDSENPAPEGAVVIADAQSAGRGRLGRKWHSPPGESLYLSLILRPKIAPHLAPPLTLMAGVALAEAVSSVGGDAELKWPNDLLLEGRKVAGILTEMATSGRGIEHVIVGIGVNLKGREFPPEIAGRATSLAISLSKNTGYTRSTEIDRDSFAATLLGSLEGWYWRFIAEGAGPIVAAWKSRARGLGRRVEVNSGGDRIVGVAQDVDESGALLVRDERGGLVKVVAGEIAL